jgi:purine-binding chemotaxis protein CheW
LLLLVLSIDDQRYALHLDAVERVVRVVEITPVPDAPAGVLGVVNVYGRIVPVLDFRRRLGLPEKEIELTDQLVIARASGRPVALLADAALGVVDYPEDKATAVREVVPGAGASEAMATLEGGIVFVEDLDGLCGPDAWQPPAAASGG